MKVNCHCVRRSGAILLSLMQQNLIHGDTSAFSFPTGKARCCSVRDHSVVGTLRSCFSIPWPSQNLNYRLQSTKWSEGEELPPATNSDSTDRDDTPTPVHKNKRNEDPTSTRQRIRDENPLSFLFRGTGLRKGFKLPPLQVDDSSVLLYDVILIVNLSLSISFCVTHRVDFSFLPSAFNEGCLFSLLWIVAGLYHGSFLYSAVDGHYPPNDESGRGGPLAAAALAFNTYINAINLRLVAALLGAWVQHRQVGMDPMEELLPLEIGFGLVLMTLWRGLHSSYTPRM